MDFVSDSEDIFVGWFCVEHARKMKEKKYFIMVMDAPKKERIRIIIMCNERNKIQLMNYFSPFTNLYMASYPFVVHVEMSY